MKNDKNNVLNPEQPGDHNRAKRDFQRTGEDRDVSKLEKDELAKRKKRTARASTKPNKNRMS